MVSFLISDVWKTYSGSLDVGSLCLTALLTLRVLVQNVHWRSRSHIESDLNIRF